MNSENKIGRRGFLALSGGLTAFAAGALEFGNPETVEAAVPQSNQMERFMLDSGHRGSRSGPVTALPNGNLLWITTEPEAPYLAKSMWSISRLAIRRSIDGGKSWSEPKILQQGTKEYSLLSNGLKTTKSGTLLHVFCRYSGYDYDTGTPAKSLCELFFTRSTNSGQTWSEPQKMPTGERYNADVLSIEQLRDGRIIYPFCFLTDVKSQFAVSVMYSDDDGKSWNRSSSILIAGGGGFESGASEPTVVELSNGKLWMLVRAQTGFQWESFSNDRGQTWSPAQPSVVPSSNAPATALRLKNGEIAVAWNNHVDSRYGRQSLVIGLTNDGKTFKAMREIDFTDFADNPAEPTPSSSYSYLVEAKDGTIIVSYNKGLWMRHNRQMLARINPAWISVKEDIIDFHNGRTGWHTVNPGPNLKAAVERYVTDDKNLWLEIEQNAKYKEPTGILTNIPLVVDGEINLTVQATKPDSYILFGNTLLAPGNITEACLRIRFAKDNIYLAAGNAKQQERNRNAKEEYSFFSHQIKDEIPYPQLLKTDGVMNISVRYQATTSKASISINGGQLIELNTGKILGLSCIGLIVGNGGQIRIKSIRTTLK